MRLFSMRAAGVEPPIPSTSGCRRRPDGRARARRKRVTIHRGQCIDPLACLANRIGIFTLVWDFQKEKP